MGRVPSAINEKLIKRQPMAPTVAKAMLERAASAVRGAATEARRAANWRTANATTATDREAARVATQLAEKMSVDAAATERLAAGTVSVSGTAMRTAD